MPSIQFGIDATGAVQGARVFDESIKKIIESSKVAVQALGALFLLSAVVAAVLVIERMRALARWWQQQGDAVVRLWGLLSFVFGALLAYAAG